MIEPIESEAREDLDRFLDAMEAIRGEIDQVTSRQRRYDNNAMVNAPHTQDDVMAADWDRPYSRETAARPAPWLREHKVWPSVNRIDNVYGDRNLVCSCPPLDAYLDD